MSLKFIRYIAIFIIAGTLSAIEVARAEDTSLAESELSVPNYRTVYAPADRICELGRGYLPMRRDEFERLLAKIQAAANTPHAARARIERAVYVARLEGEELIDAVARLQVY